MTITQVDFNKIWASTSSVPEYTFSDADYQDGWEFVGNLPPTRAMWDTLQRRNDQKMKYLKDNGSMCFDSVADMVASNLESGQTVITKGYYSVNDGGSALYTIRAKDVADVDDGGSIIFLDNGKVAELITDGIVNIKQFGAVGDGTTDDTSAFQNAAKMQGVIVFNTNEKYLIKDVIRLKKNTTIDFNGCSIKFEYTPGNDPHTFFNFEYTDTFLGYNGNGNITIKNGYFEGATISFAHADGISIINCHFKDTINDHYFEICACKNYLIENCSFEGMPYRNNYHEYLQIDCCDNESFPWFPADSITYDNTVNENLTIRNCSFKKGTRTGYTTFNVGVGSHVYPSDNVYHKNITINNCTFEGHSFRAIRLLQVENACVINNKFDSTGGDVGSHDVQIDKGNNVCVENNDFYNSKDISVFVNDSSQYVSVIKNHRHGSSGGSLVKFKDSDGCTIQNNIIDDTAYGMALDNSTNTICRGNESVKQVGVISGFISLFTNGSTFKSNDEYINFVNTEYTPVDNVITLTDLPYDLTKANKLRITFGYVGSGNWCYADISSYFRRCFAVNDSYKFDLPESNHCVLKIVSANSMTITMGSSIDLRTMDGLLNGAV